MSETQDNRLSSKRSAKLIRYIVSERDTSKKETSMLTKLEYNQAKDQGISSELRVNGVLRGGWLYENKFYYMRGLTYMVIEVNV